MIDWSRVAELRDEIGAEDFGEVVDLFLEEVREVIDRLRRDGPPGDWGATLHFLKGSALNLGFDHFADLCRRGETAASGDKADQPDSAALITAFDASCTEFLAGLDRLTAA